MRGAGVNFYQIQGRGLRLSICTAPTRALSQRQRAKRAVFIEEIRRMAGQAGSGTNGPHCHPWLVVWAFWALAEANAVFHSTGVNDNEQPRLS